MASSAEDELNQGAALRDLSPNEIQARIEELSGQLEQLKLQQKEIKDRGRKEALSQIRNIWRDHELSADEVRRVDPFDRYQPPAPVQATIKGQPKPIRYQMGSNTWSGFGRKPAWVLQLEAEGGTLEDYRV